MMKGLKFLLMLVALSAVKKSRAQDIEPMPLPPPVTSNPRGTTEVNENSFTTAGYMEDTSTSTPTTETSQTEESTPSLTTTTENADLGTTSERVTETTNSEELTTSITESQEDITTEEIITTTEANKTIKQPSTSTSTSPSISTTTEANTTPKTTTTSTTKVPIINPTYRPIPKPGPYGYHLINCGLFIQKGDPYYNWINRAIIVPQRCYFCCKYTYFRTESCTQVHPYFCNC